MDIIREIRDLAARKNAVILAHNYQPGDIQDIADYTGDSLELARIAESTRADIIVFCGVHFMAESASILNPAKKVLLPDAGAGCPMADMVTPDDVNAFRSEHPGAAVVTYINSSAAVKAVSDVVCTSANARDIVERIPADTILFFPDRNLASYVQRFTSKRVIPWKGFCPTHELFSVEDLERAKRARPEALVMVHPECRPDVVERADEVLSTGGMVRFAEKTDRREVIVGTESGMIHRLQKAAPRIEFIPASPRFICPDMKKITLGKVRDSLLNESPVITVDVATAQCALSSLQKMLALSS